MSTPWSREIFWEIKDAHDRDQLQHDVKALEDWSNEWLLKSNADKCQGMHLGKSQGVYKYTMTKDDHPIELEKTTLEKDLGVHVDPSLTFSVHCEQQVNKANRLLGLIRRSYTYIDGGSLVKLFTALVRPHLEYANAVWYPAYKKGLDPAWERPETRDQVGPGTPRWIIRDAITATKTTKPAA